MKKGNAPRRQVKRRPGARTYLDYLAEQYGETKAVKLLKTKKKNDITQKEWWKLTRKQPSKLKHWNGRNPNQKDDS